MQLRTKAVGIGNYPENAVSETDLSERFKK